MSDVKMMTVLVCGGRDYTNRARLFKLLDFNRAKIAMIVHGGAKGADTLAGNWCYERGVPMMLVPAEWARFGKKAGFIRNEKMLSLGKPDLVVAFPGGAGTAMMVRLAKQSGIRVVEVDAPKPEPEGDVYPDHMDPEEALDRAVEEERACLNNEQDWPTHQALKLHDAC